MVWGRTHAIMMWSLQWQLIPLKTKQAESSRKFTYQRYKSTNEDLINVTLVQNVNMNGVLLIMYIG